MSCIGCEQPITDDTPTIKTWCCFSISHTTCFFERLSVDFNEWFANAYCPSCDTLLRSHHTQSYTVGGSTTPTQTDDPVIPRAAIRTVKQKITANNKALRAVRAKIMAAHIAFKGQAAPILSALKEMRREAIAQVKQSQEWRDSMRSMRVAYAAINSFYKQYKPTRQQMIQYKFNRYCRRAQTAGGFLRRKFYVRVS